MPTCCNFYDQCSPQMHEEARDTTLVHSPFHPLTPIARIYQSAFLIKSRVKLGGKGLVVNVIIIDPLRSWSKYAHKVKSKKHFG